MEESKNLTCKRKVTDSFCCSTSINKEEEEEEEDSLYLPKELWVLIIRILHESFCSLKQTRLVSRLWLTCSMEAFTTFFMSYDDVCSRRLMASMANMRRIGSNDYQVLANLPDRIKNGIVHISITSSKSFYDLVDLDLQQLTNLESLAADFCDLRIPQCFLPKLRTLKISSARFSAKIDCYNSYSRLALPSTLRKLKLVNVDYQKIPIEGIISATSLTYLSLSQNKIAEIDSRISTVKELKVVDLSFNLLKRVPDELSCLVNLDYLNISNNSIKKIDSGTLPTSLKALNIGSNKLKSIDFITEKNEGLTTLKMCRCSRIPLEKFSCLGSLTNLKTLSICRNNLTVLPPAVSTLTTLVTLCINHNELSTMPMECLQSLSKLVYLSLLNNPMRGTKNSKAIQYLERSKLIDICHS